MLCQVAQRLLRRRRIHSRTWCSWRGSSLSFQPWSAGDVIAHHGCFVRCTLCTCRHDTHQHCCPLSCMTTAGFGGNCADWAFVLQGTACGVHRRVAFRRSFAGRRRCRRRFPSSAAGRALPACWRPGATCTCGMWSVAVPAAGACPAMACLLCHGASMDCILLMAV